jgi:hypothetical protein
MFFLQTNVCTSERTPHAPSLMLQVAGRGYAELLTAGCIDTDLSADRRIFGRLDKTLMETTNAHHATWIKFTETHCESLFGKVEGWGSLNLTKHAFRLREEVRLRGGAVA